ncbi:hypothetical protein HNP12_003965 [Aeromonas hydrophila]|nr:hypothetical protein [Aeromonas hydrophila]
MIEKVNDDVCAIESEVINNALVHLMGALTGMKTPVPLISMWCSKTVTIFMNFIISPRLSL